MRINVINSTDHSNTLWQLQRMCLVAAALAACLTFGQSVANAQAANTASQDATQTHDTSDVKIIRRPKITLSNNAPIQRDETQLQQAKLKQTKKQQDSAGNKLKLSSVGPFDLKPVETTITKPLELMKPAKRRLPGENSSFVMPATAVANKTTAKSQSPVSQAGGLAGDQNVQQAYETDNKNSPKSEHWIRPKRNVGQSRARIAGSQPQAPNSLRSEHPQASRSSLRDLPVTKAIDVQPQAQSRATTQQGARLAPIHSPQIQVAPPNIRVHRRTAPADMPEVRVTKPVFAPAPTPKHHESARSTRSGHTQSIFITDQPQHAGIRSGPRRRSHPAAGKIARVAGEELAIQTVPAQSVLVPVPALQPNSDVQVVDENGMMSLRAKNIEMPDVLRMIADYHKLNLVLGPNVSGPVTISIRAAELNEILDAILGVAGFSWHQVDNLLYVTASKTESMDPRVQGRVVRVYQLNYVAAAEVEKVASALLSSVGSVFTSEAAADDQLKTREVVVVEDTEASQARIAQYISQIDVPPKQVLVEAHVLQIALDDEDRHGINLQSIARLNGSRISITGSSFADDPAAGPSLALRVDGTDMDSLLELIRTNTNSRTLASPKVSVVNHQEARIQIGQRLPYSVATTTQTSTIQNIQFLEVGIVMTVLPIITEDGNVLMTVSPKVSGGRITESGFPEEDTTELSTTILMPDGGGVVIGGLIREEDSQTRAFVPGLGRVPVLGHLFSRKTKEARRDELVIALVTHVMPDVYGVRSHELQELQTTLPSHALQDLKHPAMPMNHNGVFHRGIGGESIIEHQTPPQIQQPVQQQGQPQIHHSGARANRKVQLQPASTNRVSIKPSSTKRASGSTVRRR